MIERGNLTTPVPREATALDLPSTSIIAIAVWHLRSGIAGGFGFQMDSRYLTVCDVWSTFDCDNVNFAYDPSTLPPDLRLAASSQHDRSNPWVAGSYFRGEG